MIVANCISAQEYRNAQADALTNEMQSIITEACSEAFENGIPDHPGLYRAQLATVGVGVAYALLEHITDQYHLINKRDFLNMPKMNEMFLAMEEQAGRYDPKDAMLSNPMQVLDISNEIAAQLFAEVNT